LLERPGVFVYGSNDLFSPTPKNPTRYLWRTSQGEHERKQPDLPWEELRDEFTSAGWLDANNQRGRIKAGELDIAVGGVHDSHIRRDRYDRIAGQADPSADLRLGVLHSPEPRVLDRFEADGYDLLLAGHTHGGQLCIPGFAAGQGTAPLRPLVAARVGWTGNVAVGAGQIRVPPRGDLANAYPPGRLAFVTF
jgi:predicted MPP superfamily phosphohydrolase